MANFGRESILQQQGYNLKMEALYMPENLVENSSMDLTITLIPFDLNKERVVPSKL
jgi:hypothetical protein